MEDKPEGMDRAAYFVARLGVYLIAYCLGYAVADPNSDAILPLTIVELAATVWVTTYRCTDIGIDRWYSGCVLIPFASLYFLFKRGDAYHAKQALSSTAK